MQKKLRRNTDRKLSKKAVAERDIHFPDFEEISGEVIPLDEYVKEETKTHIKQDLIVYAISFFLLFIGCQIRSVVLVLAGIAAFIFEYELFRRKRLIKKAWVKKKIGIEYVKMEKDLGFDENGNHIIKIKDTMGNFHEVKAFSKDVRSGCVGFVIYLLDSFDVIWESFFFKREEIPEGQKIKLDKEAKQEESA